MAASERIIAKKVTIIMIHKYRGSGRYSWNHCLFFVWCIFVFFHLFAFALSPSQLNGTLQMISDSKIEIVPVNDQPCDDHDHKKYLKLSHPFRHQQHRLQQAIEEEEDKKEEKAKNGKEETIERNKQEHKHVCQHKYPKELHYITALRDIRQRKLSVKPTKTATLKQPATENGLGINLSDYKIDNSLNSMIKHNTDNAMQRDMLLTLISKKPYLDKNTMELKNTNQSSDNYNQFPSGPKLALFLPKKAKIVERSSRNEFFTSKPQLQVKRLENYRGYTKNNNNNNFNTPLKQFAAKNYDNFNVLRNVRNQENIENIEVSNSFNININTSLNS